MRSLLDSTEAGWIGKIEEDDDFSQAPGAGAKMVLGLRDSAAVKIVLIGQAHHMLSAFYAFWLKNYFWGRLR